MKLNDNFDNIEAFELEIAGRGFLNTWEQFQNEVMNGIGYERLTDWEIIFKPFGLSFDYYLDAVPFDFEITV